MAKIQVEINGQLQDVKKAQLFDYAKSGVVNRNTRMIYNGKETKVGKVHGIEFFDDAFPNFAKEKEEREMPMSFEVPLEEELIEEPIHLEKTEKDKIDTLFLALSLASLIPGLGHYLIGCDVWKCTWITFYAALKLIWLTCGLALVFACLIGGADMIFVQLYSIENHFWRMAAIGFFYFLAIFCVLFLIPFLFISVYWTVYHGIICNLKKEYSKRT